MKIMIVRCTEDPSDVVREVREVTCHAHAYEIFVDYVKKQVNDDEWFEEELKGRDLVDSLCTFVLTVTDVLALPDPEPKPIEIFARTVTEQFDGVACRISTFVEDGSGEPMVEVFGLEKNDFSRFAAYEEEFFLTEDSPGYSEDFLVIHHFMEATRRYYAKVYKQLREES